MQGSGTGRRWLTVATALGVAALGAGLLLDSAAVGAGVRKGLEICGGVLIPSLFPFMVLAVFLSMSDYARILSIPLRPITTRIYKLPAELGVVVLLSLIGGYPVGAKMIAGLLERRRIDRATAERMLCFCVNSGPSFLIAAVGSGMLFDRTAGVILFATQTLATLVIGWAVSRRVPPQPGAQRPGTKTAGAAVLVMAVQSATSAMLTMCAFAILFSGLLSMLGAMGVAAGIAAVLPVSEAVAQTVLSGLLEVTSGCLAASQLDGALSIVMISVIVSFSGLSVLFQIFSCFGEMPVRFWPLVVSRLVHAVLSTVPALALYRKFCAHSSVWLSARPAPAQVDGRTTLISVCLLGMCAIFTLSLGQVSAKRKK